MRFVIQRVTESEVRVDNEVIGKIGKGFMVLVGVSDSDTKEIADKMIRKMLALRIFEEDQPVPGYGGGRTAFDLPVYPLRQL